MYTVPFDIPESIEAAEDEKRTLIAEIEDIQVQLGSQRKRELYETQADYLDWRESAKKAMNQRLQRLRQLKQWVKQQYTIDPEQFLVDID